MKENINKLTSVVKICVNRSVGASLLFSSSLSLTTFLVGGKVGLNGRGSMSTFGRVFVCSVRDYHSSSKLYKISDLISSIVAKGGSDVLAISDNSPNIL